MKVAVIGAGVVGLSTSACLLQSGVDVVCFERADAVMTERSAGSSRIFRLAHVAPELVRLAAVARDGFAAWSAQTGRPMVDRSGCVISGRDVADRAKAMEAAGAAFEVVEGATDRVRVPAVVPPSPVLFDPQGGVVDVDAVRKFLVGRAGHAVVHEPVDALDGATVRTRSGSTRFDAVVVTAGAGTSVLAAQVGVSTPSALEHHVRFTFPIDDGPWPAWIDGPDNGLATYQHRSGPGRWSVGGSLDPALVAWDAGREAAEAASREAVLAYARERLTVDPTIVDALYCTHVPDTGDGIEFERSGPVLVVHGENLMKFAPVLGDVLAAAAVEGSTPTMRELANR